VQGAKEGRNVNTNEENKQRRRIQEGAEVKERI
jgi:hypothetical protein